MTSRVVKYYGDGIDQWGMREPYNSYFIALSDSPLPGSGAVASIVPLTGDRPEMDLPVPNDGVEKAFATALRVIQNLPENRNLHSIR